jgi:uncharacterized cupredoxin-like copper-binding protein
VTHTPSKDYSPVTRRFLVVSVIACAIAACSSQSQTAATDTAQVEITLEDFAVKPATDSVASGNVTFRATNAGPSYPHELKVVKTDLDPAALPSLSTGMLDQRGAGVEVVAAIEPMTAGASGELTVALAAGKYILLCNIYDDAGAHFRQGMRTAFTVTD